MKMDMNRHCAITTGNNSYNASDLIEWTKVRQQTDWAILKEDLPNTEIKITPSG